MFAGFPMCFRTNGWEQIVLVAEGGWEKGPRRFQRALISSKLGYFGNLGSGWIPATADVAFFSQREKHWKNHENMWNLRKYIGKPMKSCEIASNMVPKLSQHDPKTVPK